MIAQMDVITHKHCNRKSCTHGGMVQPISSFSMSCGAPRAYCKTCQRQDNARMRKAKGIPTRQEMQEDMTDCPLPAPPELSVQLLHLHTKRAYGAVPGQLRGVL
ncbi:hypothetical protein SAMN05216569_1088 [Pseudoxanthomonas sp. CF125]|nr:hypothetical protein SAMN05216569_1088 [Pseudoxanthomonas sp. CF125]